MDNELFGEMHEQEDKVSNSTDRLADERVLATVPKVISIEKKKVKMTDGELALLALMKRKLESSEMIVYNEVKDLYVNHVRTKKGQGGEWMSSTCDSRAKVWFKHALGNLILKAKLVAIPVIDV